MFHAGIVVLCSIILHLSLVGLLVLWCLSHFQHYFSYIMAVSFIGGGNQSIRRKLPNCHKSLTNFITWCCIEYTSPSTGFKLTALVVIGIDCTGSCKSNYHTTTTAPRYDKITTKNLWDQLLCSELTGVQIIQIKLRKISCTENFLKFGLYRILFCSLASVQTGVSVYANYFVLSTPYIKLD